MAYILPMQLLIFTVGTMLLDILADYVFIGMLTYHAYEIAIRSKLPTTPRLFLYRWNVAEDDLSIHFTFHFRHDFRRAVWRKRLDKEMYVISYGTNFIKSYLVSIRYLFANLFQYSIYFTTYYKSSVFRHKHEMIYQYRYIMTLANKFCHELIRTTTATTPLAAWYKTQRCGINEK